MVSTIIATVIQTETLNLLEWPRLGQQVATFAATKLGAIAAQSLRLPDTQAESEVLLRQTADFGLLDLRVANGVSFEGIEDIGEALARAERGGMLAGMDLWAIATTLAGVRQLRRTIDQLGGDLASLVELLVDLRTYPELEQQIYHCIDDHGRVTDRASEKLGELRDRLKRQRDEVYQRLQRILQRQGNAIQEAVITQRDNRFVIPVKASHRDLIPGIVHDTSSSGATLFVEPHSTVEANNRLRQLLRMEQAEEEAVRQRLSEAIAAVGEDLEHLLAIATTLDLAAARSRYSQWLGANRPRFLASRPESGLGEAITLRQLRHPLLVWQQQHEQGHPVVPIDLRIDPRIRVVAITGPNTGGKTVTLKTLGLAALMAKAGLFVPAREPVEIPWFDQILADIGDEQSLQQSLSTFSGHIRRISRILTALAPSPAPESPPETPSESSLDTEPDQTASVSNQPDSPSSALPPPSSLVLLDEVGAGTDPSEGSALAIALLRTLAERALLTIATTHFGELKALKYEDERFENASVEFDVETLSPTYRLLWGIPGRSNALAIAQRLGLEVEIVEAARQYVGAGAGSEVNDVIAGLEAQRRQQETKAREAEILLAQAEKLHLEVARKATMLQERERDLRQQQEAAVQAAIATAKGEIAQVIRTLQQGPQTAQRAQRATTKLDAIAAEQLPQPAPTKPKPGFIPTVGDRIRVPKIGQVAEVLSGPDGDGDLLVRFGLMKMTVSLGEIESLQGEKGLLPEKPKPEPKPEPRPEPRSDSKTDMTLAEGTRSPGIRTSRNTLDVRGQRVADAEIELDRFLAEARGPVWVIHGHGTGKLRKGIHEFLRDHAQVERFEPAEQADGGTGVTIVYVR